MQVKEKLKLLAIAKKKKKTHCTYGSKRLDLCVILGNFFL